jgi:hypothetical protein
MGHPEGPLLLSDIHNGWSLEAAAYVDEVTGQAQAEQSDENGQEIDHEAGGLEGSGFQLAARPAVAKQASEGQEDAGDNGDGAEPDGKTFAGGNAALELHELADGDSETANGKTEHDDGHAGAHPSEESAFIGKMVTGTIACCAGYRLIFVGSWLGHAALRMIKEKQLL